MFLLVACGKKEGVTITLDMDKEVPPNGQVILFELTAEGMIPVDTLGMNDEMTFEVNLLPKKETFYRVDIFRTQYVNLILSEQDDDVNITIEGTTTEIKGSDKSNMILAIENLLSKAKQDAQKLNQEAMMANQQGDNNTVQAIIDQYQDMQKQLLVEIKNKVSEASPSLVALYGLNFLDIETEFQFYDSIVSKVLEAHPDNFWASELKTNLDMIRVLAVGETAPDFTLNDPEGNPISLSHLRGKYVLIDFWAAWCRPCREENPNVVRAYQKYGGEKFEILGVSLDRTKEAWLKAINDDGLPWLHVSDLQYFNSEAARLYNINAIPATYLIDPSGKILAKNLRGPSLDEKLLELFGE